MSKHDKYSGKYCAIDNKPKSHIMMKSSSIDAYLEHLTNKGYINTSLKEIINFIEEYYE